MVNANTSSTARLWCSNPEIDPASLLCIASLLGNHNNFVGRQGGARSAAAPEQATITK
jgi:hypothetical protein